MMCINGHGDHRTISKHCLSVKLIQQRLQQQSDVVGSAPVMLPPVNHRSAPIPVNHVSKAPFADVVKQSVQDHHLTKDDAFKGFMRIMYASHIICAGSADTFQGVLNHLLQKNNLPSFSIGDCPPFSPTGISTTSSNPHSESNNTPFISNSKTSETPAAANLAA